jgi:hypothetical protein
MVFFVEDNCILRAGIELTLILTCLIIVFRYGYIHYAIGLFHLIVVQGGEDTYFWRTYPNDFSLI